MVDLDFTKYKKIKEGWEGNWGSYMRILMKISDLMNKNSKYLGSLESRYIRIPLELRDVCGIELGDFINLRSKDGEIIALKTSLAYHEDEKEDPLTAYVTEDVFNTLHLKVEGKKYEQEIDIVEGITLGCDPEFFLVNINNGSLIHAGGLFSKFGQVGHDGVMMEVRPLPSTDEIVVTNNIWNLINRARQEINSNKKIDGNIVSMIAASHYGPATAGFHLHFGLPKEILGGRYRGKRWHLQNQIARALDYYVGIPAIIPEGEEDCVRRSAPHIIYGKPGEWRIDGRTLEYRVPGGALMKHPILTMGILGLGAIVIEDAVSRIKACTNSFEDLGVMSSPEDLKDIYPNIPNIFDIYKIVCSKSLDKARLHMETILNDVVQMVGFEKRKKSIEQMFVCIYNKTEFNSNIEENWRLFYNEKQQRQVDVLPARFQASN